MRKIKATKKFLMVISTLLFLLFFSSNVFAANYTLEVNFDGKNIIPFCTSGESSIDRSQQNLEDNAGSGNWIKGTRLEGNISEDQLSGWVAELK